RSIGVPALGQKLRPTQEQRDDFRRTALRRHQLLETLGELSIRGLELQGPLEARSRRAPIPEALEVPGFRRGQGRLPTRLPHERDLLADGSRGLLPRARALEARLGQLPEPERRARASAPCSLRVRLSRRRPALEGRAELTELASEPDAR